MMSVSGRAAELERSAGGRGDRRRGRCRAEWAGLRSGSPTAWPRRGPRAFARGVTRRSEWSPRGLSGLARGCGRGPEWVRVGERPGGGVRPGVPGVGAGPPNQPLQRTRPHVPVPG